MAGPPQAAAVLIDLAGDDSLLLVAARHTAGDGGRALTTAHIVLLDEPLGIVEDGPFLNKAVVLELRLPIALQDHIVSQRIVQHQTVLMAILGNMAHAGLGALTDGCIRDVPASSLIVPPVGFSSPVMP